MDSYRESPWGKTQRDQKMGLEFSKEQYQEIDSYCKKKNIDWFASAWDLKSQIFLRDFNCKYNKIASAMLVHKELLQIVAEEKKHTFISTGLSTMKNIEEAVESLSQDCPFERLRLLIQWRYGCKLKNNYYSKRKFKCNVGYSGHRVAIFMRQLQG